MFFSKKPHCLVFRQVSKTQTEHTPLFWRDALFCAPSEPVRVHPYQPLKSFEWIALSSSNFIKFHIMFPLKSLSIIFPPSASDQSNLIKPPLTVAVRATSHKISHHHAVHCTKNFSEIRQTTFCNQVLFSPAIVISQRAVELSADLQGGEPADGFSAKLF